jgi:hypothetical protein
MNNVIGDALAGEWNAIRHHGQHSASPQERPQENTMTTTRLSAARDAISAIADNPLIDAIAEAGIGKLMHPDEISGLVSLWREVEYGRMAVQAMTPPASFSAAPVPATQVQPQQL